MFEAIGRNIRGTAQEFFDLFALIYISFKSSLEILRPSRRSIFMSIFVHHVYHAGVKTIYLNTIISILLGALLASQLQTIAHGKTFIDAYTWVYVTIIVRELAPLICGVVLISRSASAITAEISYLKISNEFEVLDGLGIDPVFIFLVPVFLAFPLAFVLMLIYFDASSVLSGYLMVSFIDPDPVGFIEFASTIINKITITETMVSLLKGLIGGLFIGIISIYFGSRAGSKFTDMSLAISNATSSQLVVFFLINTLLSIIAYG